MKRNKVLMANLRRRNLLIAGAAGLAEAWPTGVAGAHALFGPVTPPEPIPNMTVTCGDGQATELSRLLTGGITLVQLMLTGCTATCPIQGAIFADAQKHLIQADSRLRLLSVSVDPLGDDAKALRVWLERFGAQPQRWHAAVPLLSDVDRLLDFLRGRASGADRHTAQAFLFNPKAELAYRTADMPAGPDLVNLMRQMASMP